MSGFVPPGHGESGAADDPDPDRDADASASHETGGGAGVPVSPRVRGAGASRFPQIDPDHPLAIAVRELNAAAPERSLQDTVLGLMGDTLSLNELFYLAEQRAIRAGAVHLFGIALGVGLDPEDDELLTRRVIGSKWWGNNKEVLMSLYIEAVLVGWEGKRIAPW